VGKLPTVRPVAPQPGSQAGPLPVASFASATPIGPIVALAPVFPFGVTSVSIPLPLGFSGVTFKGQCRSTQAAVFDDIFVNYNRDSTANYVWQQLYGNNNVPTSNQNNVAATAQPVIARVSGSTAPAGHAGNWQFEIQNYSGGAFVKEGICTCQEYDGFGANNQAFIIHRGVRWGLMAALTVVTFGLVAGQFAAGSVIRPYVWV
jgi:hypothetical protein